MKKNSRKLFLMLSFGLISNMVFAAPPPPPGLPIDGGLGFLIAAGLIYGVSKFRKKE